MKGIVRVEDKWRCASRDWQRDMKEANKLSREGRATAWPIIISCVTCVTLKNASTRLSWLVLSLYTHEHTRTESRRLPVVLWLVKTIAQPPTRSPSLVAHVTSTERGRSNAFARESRRVRITDLKKTGGSISGLRRRRDRTFSISTPRPTAPRFASSLGLFLSREQVEVVSIAGNDTLGTDSLTLITVALLTESRPSSPTSTSRVLVLGTVHVSPLSIYRGMKNVRGSSGNRIRNRALAGRLYLRAPLRVELPTLQRRQRD